MENHKDHDFFRVFDQVLTQIISQLTENWGIMKYIRGHKYPVLCFAAFLLQNFLPFILFQLSFIKALIKQSKNELYYLLIILKVLRGKR